ISFSGGNDHFVRIPSSASLNRLKKQITVVAFIYPRTLWKPASYYDRFISKVQRQWNKALHTLFSTPTESENADRPSSTGFIAIVQRQWRETIHPDQFYLGYGPEKNVLHYKWHLGLMGGEEVSLYRLPAGQDKPRVGEWVHLASTYNGETG